MAPPSKHPQNIISEKNITSNVYTESIRLIYHSTLSAVGAIVTAVSFLVYLFNDHIPSTTLYGWACYMGMVALLRLGAYLLFQRNEEKIHQSSKGFIVIVMALLTGLGWGASSVLFWPLLTFDLQLLLVLVIVAYTAGALTTTFPVPIALQSLLLPSVAPLSILFLSCQENSLFPSAQCSCFFLRLSLERR